MYEKRPGAGSAAGSLSAALPAASPGKRTLTESLGPSFVQALASPAASSSALLRAGAELTGGDPASPAAADPAAAAQTAAGGVAGASGRLPHHDRIQAAFGRHDLSGVRVASDAAAAGASDQLGAQAYAFGDRIALPHADLRTEAHEAAHVIQQRSGRVAAHGTAGDAHERHADAVADRVVAGESAAELLDEVAGAAGSASASADHVQLFTTKNDNIVVRWGYAVTAPAQQADVSAHKRAADQAFGALRTALQQYEAAATIATAEGVVAAATAFGAAYKAVPAGVNEQGASPGRVNTQLSSLINEAQAELHTQLGRVATTPVVGRSKAELVDDAVAQLGDPERRREQKRILRHEQALGMKAKELADVTDAHGPAILQSWRARGDMYHVGAVLNLYPQLKVILYDLPAPGGVASSDDLERERERGDRWEQACMIADYYGQPDRVFYTRSDGVAAKASKGHAYDFKTKASQNAPAEELAGLFIDVGGCTTVLGLDLAEARGKGAQAYGARKKELAAAVAPAPGEAEDRASAAEIKAYLAANGWDDNERYVIINFRDSGHAHIQKKIAAAPAEQRQGVIAGYDPVRDQVGGNHPDLDTGTVGVQQLADKVRAHNFKPVFMGEEPANAEAPHLIKYWAFKHHYGEPAQERQVCRGGRAAEAYFIRVLAETYNVRLLSMRSGVTDQLAFLGIPTISIDVDNFHQNAVPALQKEPGYKIPKDETAHSWARGTKLESGFERDYGRVFLEEERPLNDFDNRGKWKGEFSEPDIATIDNAIGFYFGTKAASAPATNGVRHESHPFHPAKMAATDGKGEADSKALHKAALGKIDTGLNPETVLAHMRAILGAQPPKVAEAQQFADGQLAFMASGEGVVKLADVEHRAAKLAQRRAFLQSAVALLTPHGAQAAYAQELAELAGRQGANAPRRIRMEQAIAKLREAIRFPGVDRKDGKLVECFQVIDAVDLRTIEARLATAKTVCAVEQPALHTTRLDRIANLVETAHTTITGAVDAGKQRQAQAANRYYARYLEVAGEKLAAIDW